ncbi:MAG TPA: transposase [Planctomycetota bacterium]|nr:transposase [Planctomycetota bacterium]
MAAFSVAFTRPTFQRVTVLILGAILSLRQRTVTALLRAVGPLAKGHWSDFHRVLCRASWSCWPLGKVLAAMVLELIPADQPVICPVDDTTPQHKGKHVYGKGRHHDACRSTHSHVVWIWGHKWVTLAINVKFPFASRPWALPVLCALYRPEELNRAEGRRRHKTPIRLAMQLIATLIHWFPERTFVLLGDGGYASHELARFCWRHRRHVTLVSRFYPDANLYDPPPHISRKGTKGGRPRLKGRKLPGPSDVVQRSKARRFTVSWYGGKTRRVELISGVGHWYKGGQGLVPVRWVFVHDLTGTHRDQYFYTTDVALAPDQIVSLYTGRWSIEVTYEEARAHLGFATVRNWSAKSVLRTAPCLLGLFSVVSLIFARLVRDKPAAVKPASSPWYAKREASFSDAIARVRRLCWVEVLKRSQGHAGALKLPHRLHLTLLDQLSRAA